MKAARLPPDVKTGTVEIKAPNGKQVTVNTYDFSHLRADSIEPVLANPQSLRILGKIAKNHDVSITLDPPTALHPEGDNVMVSSRRSKWDPDAGTFAKEVEPMHDLTADERASLAKALKPLIGTEPLYQEFYERLTGIKTPESANAGGVSRQLKPVDGRPLAGGKGIIGDE